MTKITREQFIKAVGTEPVQDDLERCNCVNAGLIGHDQCGWSKKWNKPNFMLTIGQVRAEQQEDQMFAEQKKAHAEGKQIQINMGMSHAVPNWVDCDPQWATNREYRVKPDEPKDTDNITTQLEQLNAVAPPVWVPKHGLSLVIHEHGCDVVRGKDLLFTSTSIIKVIDWCKEEEARIDAEAAKPVKDVVLRGRMTDYTFNDEDYPVLGMLSYLAIPSDNIRLTFDGKTGKLKSAEVI